MDKILVRKAKRACSWSAWGGSATLKEHSAAVVAKARLENWTFLHVRCSRWVSEVISSAHFLCKLAKTSGWRPALSCTLHGLDSADVPMSLTSLDSGDITGYILELPGSVTFRHAIVWWGLSASETRACILAALLVCYLCILETVRFLPS